MAKWWWKDPEAWESAIFKRVQQGWVYRSPIQWGPFGIGRPSHFLLSEAQKDELSNVLRRLNWYLAPAIVVVFFPGYLLFWSFRDVWFSAPLTAVVVFALYLLCAQYIYTLIYWLMLRSSLADGQPTSERITVGERFNAFAMIVPRGVLIFYAVFLAALLLLLGYVALRAKIWDLTLLASLVLFGGSIAGVLALLAAKRRAKQN